MRALAIVGGLITCAPAYAEGPIVVRLGIGIAAEHSWCGLDRCESVTRYGYGFQSDVAYRVMDGMAVGAHVGIAVTSGTLTDEASNVFHVDYTTVQLGFGLHLSTDRLWFAPWVGVSDSGESNQQRTVAFGVAGGADLYVDPTGHRVGAYLDISGGPGGVLYAPDTSELYVSAGLAYRYW